MYPLMERWGVSSHYGPRPAVGDFHYGIDFPCPVGTPVPSPIDGVMRLSGFYAGEGLLTVEAHDGSENWTVGHCSQVNQKVGATVKRGQIIGLTGNTGNSTGPHDHTELCEGRFNGSITANHASGRMRNPYDRLRTWGESATGPDKEPMDPLQPYRDIAYQFWLSFKREQPARIDEDAVVLRGLGTDEDARARWGMQAAEEGGQMVSTFHAVEFLGAALGVADPVAWAEQQLTRGDTYSVIAHHELGRLRGESQTLRDQRDATGAALNDANRLQGELRAQLIARDEEIRALHIRLEQTEGPPADVSLNGLRLLGAYINKLVKKESKEVRK